MGRKMISRQRLLTCIACIAFISALLGLLGGSAVAETPPCKEPATGTKDVPLFAPPLAHVVTGAGRLQFYSAPDARCPMNGVFVIPEDEVIAYAQTDDGWSSVTYSNPKTGNNVSGWVRSARLKETGTVGPKQ